MKKRFISLIVALCMIWSMMPVTVSAAEVVASGTCGENVRWVLTEDGTLTISGTGAMTDYSSEEDVPWYPYISMIETIVIESGVTTIGDYTFYNCYNLTGVTIPDSVTSIGIRAFYYCDSLASVTIPDCVTTIADECFSACNGITSMTIGDGVTTISKGAFSGCDNLTNVTIGNSVTTIGGYAFYECNSLTSIIIPDSATTISEYAFHNCKSLTSVIMGCGVTSIDFCAFNGCNALESVDIPDSITTIGQSAFAGCDNLTNVTFGDSITSIGVDAFRYCPNLSKIKFRGNAPTIDRYAFHDVTADAYYPEGNNTWTASKKQNYGGTLTWIPYTGEGHNHSYSAMVTAPTCTESGYTTYTCSCGNSYIDDEIPALGHTGGVATCINQAVCSRCRNPYSEVDPSNHTGDFVTTNIIRATCTTPGYTGDKYCMDCDAMVEIGQEIPIENHSMGPWTVIKDNTCTEDGTIWRECSGCGLEETGTLSAYGHAMKTWTITQEPTCTESGTRSCSCNNSGCDYSETRSIDALGHDWVNGTCTVPNSCARCGEIEDQVPGHTWDNGVVKLEPTENETGILILTCTVCGATKEESIPKVDHEHVYSFAVTAPTCIESGYTTYTCTCGDSYTADEVPATGHTEVVDEAIPATCTENGKTEGSHCSVCGEILVAQSTIPATGHTEVIDKAVPATCTDNGLTEGSHCSVCNEILVAQVVIEAAGHRYSEGICETCGAKDPDYTKPEENTDVLIISDQQTISNQTINSDVYITSTGRATFNNVIVNGDIYCHGQLTANDCTANDVYAYAYGSMLTCDAFDGTHGLITGSLTCNTLTITDDALDYAFAKWGKGTDAPPEDHMHQYTTVVTAPTCTTGGYTTYTCECGNSYIDDEVPALGHNEVVDAAVAATCIESGLTEGAHCSICGEVIAAQNVVPATGHTEVIDEAVPATCTTEGKTQGSHCSICNAVIVSQNTVAATGHTEVIDKAVDATCTEDGLTEGTHCSVCNTVIIVQKVVEATGHTFTDGFCEICGAEDPDYVQPTEPSVPEETDPSEPEETKPTDPDVTEPSEPEESEPTVPSEPEDPTIPSEPEEHTHVYGEWVRVKDPTSNEEGLEERICACGQSELRIIDKLTNPFSDVKKGDYFYEPVLWAANKGITSGMSATSFGPNLSCTRGHIVTFLWRAAGEPEPATTVNPFNDVKESAFYYKAVLWAVENGITTGMKEGEFWPNYTCNRAQAVTFLYRAAGEPEIQSNANPFSDVKGDAYYRNAVLWAVENNVTNGMGNGKFEPNYTCTRGQIVTFLYRSFSK